MQLAPHHVVCVSHAVELAVALAMLPQVISAVGTPEDASNFSGPKKIDGEGTIALVNEAAKVRTATGGAFQA